LSAANKNPKNKNTQMKNMFCEIYLS